MAREKKTPEQEGQEAYRFARYSASRKTDRELVSRLGYAHSDVAQRENLNTYRLAPFAEAKERAKLQAIRDEIMSRRYAIDVTIDMALASALTVDDQTDRSETR